LPRPGEEEYENAYFIGKELAKNGFNICSGGAQGIMDAVSKGAVEGGAEAIGITVALFNSTSSKNLTKEIKCNTLFERLDKLIEYGDGFVILPGGTGTLVELSLIWELFNKRVMPTKPVACLGSLWEKIVLPIEERVKIEKRNENLVKCYNSSTDVIDFIIKEVKQERYFGKD